VHLPHLACQLCQPPPPQQVCSCMRSSPVALADHALLPLLLLPVPLLPMPLLRLPLLVLLPVP